MELENDQKDALEVLDALATLIVRRYEIIAVTAKQSETGLHVLTSLTSPKNTLATPLPSPSQADSDGSTLLSRYFWKAFHMLVTGNPRRDPMRKDQPEADSLVTKDLKLKHLTLVDPDTSAKLAGLTEVDDDKLLDTFLKTKW